VWALAFTRTGRLAMGDGNGVTYLWQLDAPTQTATLTGSLLDPSTGTAGVGSVALSADGRWLVTGDSNGSGYLWRAG
jgi:WD40 repeat protein